FHDADFAIGKRLTELAAYLTGREHGRVHVHVVAGGILADGLDQRGVGVHTSIETVHGLDEIDDNRTVGAGGALVDVRQNDRCRQLADADVPADLRSEEHTSELQ